MAIGKSSFANQYRSVCSPAGSPKIGGADGINTRIGIGQAAVRLAAHWPENRLGV